MAATAAAASTSMARPRSADVLGVVILDAGKRSPAADDMLLSVASVYGRMTRREVVSVANTATLEAAVRGCMEDGATKVMVVPYCTSLEFQPDTNPAIALAEVQSRLPGIRCMMGETISVSTMLAEVIESQVKVVDGRRPDVAERWFAPEPRAVNRSAWSDWKHTQHSTAGAAGAAGAQHHQQAERAAEHAVHAAHAAASHSMEGSSSSSAKRAWSDDFSSVMVVDYRHKPGSNAAEAATATASRSSQQPAETATASSAEAVSGHANGAAVNGTAVNGTTAHSPVMDGHVNGTAANSSSKEAGLNRHTTIPSNSPAHNSSSSSPTVTGNRFADWAGVSNNLDGSSNSTARSTAFADWAGDGSDSRPVYGQVLDQRLTGIEDQLQRIAVLLEMMPKAQQAQQALQAQAALQLHQDGDKASNAVPLRLPPPKPKKPFILRFLRGQT